MQDTKIVNGLNTIQMYETIAAIKNQPENAKFQFRSRNQWIGGGEIVPPSRILMVVVRKILLVASRSCL